MLRGADSGRLGARPRPDSDVDVPFTVGRWRRGASGHPTTGREVAHRGQAAHCPRPRNPLPALLVGDDRGSCGTIGAACCAGSGRGCTLDHSREGRVPGRHRCGTAVVRFAVGNESRSDHAANTLRARSVDTDASLITADKRSTKTPPRRKRWLVMPRWRLYYRPDEVNAGELPVVAECDASSICCNGDPWTTLATSGRCCA